ncbi:hypothetical protein CAC42_8150 [Sphaceloma murrayae]|uniref:Uncharacterized protein n=1 Tax=Sphaceloma murrayae TaxID=2082308 RepID=A0A2K1QJT0_9PEZI|nr:hypothetical protein CAC42_8150 [Sphaceloma murrayae]
MSGTRGEFTTLDPVVVTDDYADWYRAIEAISSDDSSSRSSSWKTETDSCAVASTDAGSVIPAIPYRATNHPSFAEEEEYEEPDWEDFDGGPYIPITGDAESFASLGSSFYRPWTSFRLPSGPTKYVSVSEWDPKLGERVRPVVRSGPSLVKFFQKLFANAALYPEELTAVSNASLSSATSHTGKSNITSDSVLQSETPSMSKMTPTKPRAPRKAISSAGRVTPIQPADIDHVSPTAGSVKPTSANVLEEKTSRQSRVTAAPTIAPAKQTPNKGPTTAISHNLIDERSPKQNILAAKRSGGLHQKPPQHGFTTDTTPGVLNKETTRKDPSTPSRYGVLEEETPTRKGKSKATHIGSAFKAIPKKRRPIPTSATPQATATPHTVHSSEAAIKTIDTARPATSATHRTRAAGKSVAFTYNSIAGRASPWADPSDPNYPQASFDSPWTSMNNNPSIGRFAQRMSVRRDLGMMSFDRFNPMPKKTEPVKETVEEPMSETIQEDVPKGMKKVTVRSDSGQTMAWWLERDDDADSQE